MRYFIYLSYNGKNYCGWQIQPNGITVQEELEKALSTILRHPVSITGAGRTDTGVHAALMVAHFDTKVPLDDPAQLCEKLNRLLPRDVAISAICPVKPDAHARFDATSRTYKYYVTDKKDVFRGELACKIHGKMDFAKMNEAAKILFEYTDFTSFSKLHTDVKTNNCRMMQAEWKEENGQWVFTIQADRFLRNMVRAVVGTLFEVGRGKIDLEGFRRVIELKDRCKAGTSAPAHALFLVDIEYPREIMIEGLNE
ncbi:tRNA pseudouridine(38-40) synthase TruA [Parabacteroides sp. FAFU027]|uniref:tRNA pseudouridine(38-40) synthase TruA n=1 Tax=Parabacteroides sp. FAFU027 TaxID=2922715 RepID=UPI001FAEFC6E|nr:tRNA pseudouridine(38-40) synthase TruA [Parabacteroides sp. FAFU027]